ncbi:MAG TPA: cytochrome P460 family protein [Steroidobacteraceae bacterium]|jgi:hypothetical protein
MKIAVSLATVAVLVLTTGAISAVLAAGEHKARGGPDYTADGKLQVPSDYREWVFLTSSLDMNYGTGPGMDHSMFDNVFVPPSAYQSFLRTGKWPEGAVLLKENRVASSNGSINKSGQFQVTSTMGLEVHVKDSQRFAGTGWGFFVFPDAHSQPATVIPSSASCYSCHKDHGAVDTTFVQFYPTLIDTAKQKKTLSPTYEP